MKWRNEKIRDVAQVKNGFAFKSTEYTDNGLRVIRITNVQKGEIVDSNPQFVESRRVNEFSGYALYAGDILISLTGNVGRVGILTKELEPAVLNQRVACIRVTSKDAYAPYLFQYLNSNVFEAEAINNANGIAQLNLSSKWVENFTIPLPPLDNQIRIATVLTRAERLIAKRKESIKALDELLKSTFLEMFGDPVRNEKGWERKTLKSFGQIITGNTPPRNNDDNYSSNFMEWIKTDNIVENQIYITVASEFLSETGLQRARLVTSGALLVACIAGSVESIGRAAITDRTVSFNQQINAIQPNKEINVLFLYWLFKISKLYIQSHATKGMKKILTKGDFEKILTIKRKRQVNRIFPAFS